MKRLITLLVLLFAFSVSAQVKPQARKAKATIQAKQKSIKAKKARYSRAGKAVPGQSGSGMTIPDQDKPKLNGRPNPAQTVPATRIPVDGDPLPR